MLQLIRSEVTVETGDGDGRRRLTVEGSRSASLAAFVDATADKKPHRLLQVDGDTVLYTIRHFFEAVLDVEESGFANGQALFDSITASLAAAVSDGTFLQALKQAAAALGVTYPDSLTAGAVTELVNIIVVNPEDDDPTVPSDDKDSGGGGDDGLTDTEIGIIISCSVVFVAILSGVVIYILHKKRVGERTMDGSAGKMDVADLDREVDYIVKAKTGQAGGDESALGENDEDLIIQVSLSRPGSAMPALIEWDEDEAEMPSIQLPVFEQTRLEAARPAMWDQEDAMIEEDQIQPSGMLLSLRLAPLSQRNLRPLSTMSPVAGSSINASNDGTELWHVIEGGGEDVEETNNPMPAVKRKVVKRNYEV